MNRTMKRGEIWTISAGVYAGKPRPAVILQSNAFQSLDSVTVCPFTTDLRGTEIVRVLIEPNDQNHLLLPSKLMADKVSTIAKSKLGKYLGALGDDDMRRLERAVMTFLGLG
jgi:mRNA interferase MazF